MALFCLFSWWVVLFIHGLLTEFVVMGILGWRGWSRRRVLLHCGVCGFVLIFCVVACVRVYLVFSLNFGCWVLFLLISPSMKGGRLVGWLSFPRSDIRNFYQFRFFSWILIPSNMMDDLVFYMQLHDDWKYCHLAPITAILNEWEILKSCNGWILLASTDFRYILIPLATVLGCISTNSIVSLLTLIKGKHGSLVTKRGSYS